MMPNSVFTVIAEFAKHGFHPSHIYETRLSTHDGGTTMLMKNCQPWTGFVPVERPLTSTEFDIHLLPDDVQEVGDRTHPFDLQAAIYNLRTEPRSANARLQLLDADGTVASEITAGPLHFQARVRDKGDAMSISSYFTLELDLPAATCDALLTLIDLEIGKDIATARATLAVRG